MRAVQVVEFGRPPVVAEVPEPVVQGPDDVVVRIAGAGICRTDLHIVEGGLEAAFQQRLPLTLGHENAGWVEAVGTGVSHVAVGDPVIVHPAVTCGFCDACRRGMDMHCGTWRFPGVDGWAGGYAELMVTSARALVKLAQGTEPATLAPFADAGLTAMHAVRRLAPFVSGGGVGATVVCLGAGGVGQIAVQLLKILTPATVVVVEPDSVRAETARTLGADAVLPLPAEQAADAVLDLTGGRGAQAVLDLVGEGAVPEQAMRMLAKGAVYSIVGYGGGVRIEHLDMINRELTLLGNQIGTHAELSELMRLVAAGRVSLATEVFPLDAAAEAMAAVGEGKVAGRAVLVP
ncbi:alcohol dehydrogenase catalytic domain-containing protein [Catenulispora subtropica]|uniref:NAD(P)-dependent alcohol dehydrogenase n=1 Tax=Catenulispora subtropica TaxID=450798 RepID=A0ABN2S7W3_9ACTN